MKFVTNQYDRLQIIVIINSITAPKQLGLAPMLLTTFI